ncbi:MAG: DNA repair protein RecN [Candidatus Rokubacteria bacterium]|nr:DNA repair protein RecN [Candidatus Rokubacteria bacterium]MBI3827777.1 DNA repair protein RecN [Candidatus Rokubacteria bacterium]
MLRELRIRNLAVIESVTVTFGPGLNVLTGETGAGKSILIDAILLVRGARAQADVIRTDVDSATVEAVFDRDEPAATLLGEAGIPAPPDEPLVVRRELNRSGRHRAFVNDSPVSVGLLERLGDQLVEVHGQHEHQRLLAAPAQLDLVDLFGGADELRARVAGLHAKHRAAVEEIARMRGAERDRAQREDLLKFQLSELDAARLRPGEEEELRTERRRLQHAERLAAALDEVGALLRDDAEAAMPRLARAARVLRDAGRLDAEFAIPAGALDAAQAQVEEALLAVRGLRDGIVFDPGRLETVDERLDALTRLKRKYGESEEAMLAFRDGCAVELDRLERHEELVAGEERRLAELQAELVAAAEALSARRRQAAARLAAATQRELRTLGMERARFEVAVEGLPDGEISARGADRVELRFSANPGEEPRPLARIASGGELSRTMLALTTVLAAEGVPCMIFDEIDAGVGGSAAAVVAEKLAAAGAGRQVLCVTHLAAVAARASAHLVVSKTVRGGRTRAAVSLVEGDDRVAEVARMLGGDRPSETALRHARELLAARRGRRG